MILIANSNEIKCQYFEVTLQERKILNYSPEGSSLNSAFNIKWIEAHKFTSIPLEIISEGIKVNSVKFA